jgi:FKBP-type peptidyl-prolyl cis-trans isomerase SlyD
LKVGKNTVVRFEYTLKSDAGEVLDSSEGGEALMYLHGEGQIVPGLEKAMEGKGAGDTFDVKVSPEEGYGKHEDEAVFEIPKAKLPKGLNAEVGMELASRGPNGESFRFRIVKIAEDSVTADANHPLAGANLNFAIKIVEVRAATAEELEHGHAHGGDGHHHH